MEVTRLMKKASKSKNKIMIKIYRKLSKFLGCYIGPNVKIGNNVIFVHNSIGTVIHSGTIIEDNVRIYQNVTLGQKDVYEDEKDVQFIIKKGAILCAGAKILCSSRKTNNRRKFCNCC